ncbi:MAG: hypothetical protein ABWX96_22290, partial [Propionibacteriaceae bacterium]
MATTVTDTATAEPVEESTATPPRGDPGADRSRRRLGTGTIIVAVTLVLWLILRIVLAGQWTLEIG